MSVTRELRRRNPRRSFPAPLLGRACPPPPSSRRPGLGGCVEVKHDGFRPNSPARQKAAFGCFPAKVPTLAGAFHSSSWRSPASTRSCLIDGEVIVCDENGLAVFDRIRSHGTLADAVHCAFDLLELDGEDLRRQPLEERKELLAELLHQAPPSYRREQTFRG